MRSSPVSSDGSGRSRNRNRAPVSRSRRSWTRKPAPAKAHQPIRRSGRQAALADLVDHDLPDLLTGQQVRLRSPRRNHDCLRFGWPMVARLPGVWDFVFGFHPSSPLQLRGEPLRRVFVVNSGAEAGHSPGLETHPSHHHSAPSARWSLPFLGLSVRQTDQGSTNRRQDRSGQSDTRPQLFR